MHNATYIPFAHYWQTPDAIWSSAARAYVPADDATLTAWRAAGGAPTVVNDAADIRAALTAAGFADRAPGYVPAIVEMWQARAALRAFGKLTAATTAVNAIGGSVRDAWEYGNTVRRDAPVIAAMGQALEISSTEMDALFVSAEKARV
jgi:hypothetical protein